MGGLVPLKRTENESSRGRAAVEALNYKGKVFFEKNSPIFGSRYACAYCGES